MEERPITALQHNLNAAAAKDLTPFPQQQILLLAGTTSAVLCTKRDVIQITAKCIMGHDTATELAAVELLGHPQRLTAHNQSDGTSSNAFVTVMAVIRAINWCIN